MKNVFQYLFIAAIITVVFGAIYGTVQQSYRTGANDPQEQLVRDINTKLHEGKSVDQYLNDTIDIGQSLAPFNALFDSSGKVLRSSGFLHNRLPELPAGVFEFARSHHENVLTWQPESGVRMAMVIRSTNASPVSFIASGRSLSEVEVREHNLTTMVVIGWIVCIGLLLLYAVVAFYKNKETV